MKKNLWILSIALIISFCIVSCNKKSLKDDSKPVDTTKNQDTIKNQTTPLVFAKGADVGWLSEMEAAGRKFYNSAGEQQNCFDVLKSKGINSIRLRVWVNPTDGWNNKADVVAKAVRAKNKGFRIMIDFHYSDTWADPGHQTKPAAWANYTLDQLCTAVYNHTYEVLSTLKTNGIVPEWVQTGNETDNGLLWPTAKLTETGGPAAYVKIINSGYDAVKAVDTTMKTIVHVSNGNKNGLFRWNFDILKNGGAKWDIIGMSSYPSVNDWISHNNNVLANMQDLVARYGKPVMISEIGMDVNAAQTCKDMLTDLMTKVNSLDNNGLGVFYWEPEAYNWNNYALVAFDKSGKPTIAMDAFLKDYSITGK